MSLIEITLNKETSLNFRKQNIFVSKILHETKTDNFHEPTIFQCYKDFL